MTLTTPTEEHFAALIGDAVSLNDTLGNHRWPQARHHVRMLATRAAALGHLSIRSAALDLLAGLEASVRPDPSLWKPRLVALNEVIDKALDDSDGATPAG